MCKALALLVSLLAVSLTGTAQGASARQPTVVEFYTSQGCLACQQAGETVGDLADRKGLLVLSFSVDYWDYLGWKDSFAQPVFTTRQRDYAARFGRINPRDGDAVTPQVIVGGRWQVAGGDAEDIDALLKQASSSRLNPPRMTLGAATVSIGSGTPVSGGANVWLIRYDPRELVTRVQRGENRGQTFHQRNVVKQLAWLGVWSGGAKSFKLKPAEETGLETVILLQGASGGRILGAAISAK